MIISIFNNIAVRNTINMQRRQETCRFRVGDADGFRDLPPFIYSIVFLAIGCLICLAYCVLFVRRSWTRIVLGPLFLALTCWIVASAIEVGLIAIEACGASSWGRDEAILFTIQVWFYCFAIWLLWAVTLLPLSLRAYRIPDSRPCRPLMAFNVTITMALLALTIAVGVDETRSLWNSSATDSAASYRLDAVLRASYFVAAVYAGITMIAAWMRRPAGGPKGTATGIWILVLTNALILVSAIPFILDVLRLRRSSAVEKLDPSEPGFYAIAVLHGLGEVTAFATVALVIATHMMETAGSGIFRKHRYDSLPVSSASSYRGPYYQGYQAQGTLSNESTPRVSGTETLLPQPYRPYSSL